MTLREAAAALQSAYPKLKITPIATAMPAIAKPVAYGLSTYPGGADGEVVNVSVVLPPSQQRVWAVYRKAGNMAGPRAVNRGTLLASLRQKYGKESYAITSGEPPLPKNDSEISQIYWLFDEQGKRLSGQRFYGRSASERRLNGLREKCFLCEDNERSRGVFGGLHRGLRVEKNDDGAGHGSDHGEEGQHADDIACGGAAEESERHCGDGRQRETLPDEMEQGPTERAQSVRSEQGR